MTPGDILREVARWKWSSSHLWCLAGEAGHMALLRTHSCLSVGSTGWLRAVDWGPQFFCFCREFLQLLWAVTRGPDSPAESPDHWGLGLESVCDRRGFQPVFMVSSQILVSVQFLLPPLHVPLTWPSLPDSLPFWILGFSTSSREQQPYCPGLNCLPKDLSKS